MTQVIDAEGNLFERVNVVDAFVIFVVGSALTVGGLYVHAEMTPEATTYSPAQITVRAAVPDYQLRAIEGAAADGVSGGVEIVGVDAYALPGPANATVADTRYRVELRAIVTAERRPDGRLHYGGERLYVGREIRLDLGETIVEGVVVELGGDSRER